MCTHKHVVYGPYLCLKAPWLFSTDSTVIAAQPSITHSVWMNMVGYFSPQRSQCLGPRDTECFCWRSWLNGLNWTYCMGKKRKTYKHSKVRHRHGHTQANKSEHSFTVRVVWPYLSPSHSEAYACVAAEGWCTPRQPLLPFNIHQRVKLGQPTSLTFMGSSDNIVHRIVITYIGFATVCVCVCVCEGTLGVTCRADVLHQCRLHCTSIFNRSVAL